MNEPQRPPGMTDEMEAAYALAARDQDSARCREIIESLGLVWKDPCRRLQGEQNPWPDDAGRGCK